MSIIATIIIAAASAIAIAWRDVGRDADRAEQALDRRIADLAKQERATLAHKVAELEKHVGPDEWGESPLWRVVHSHDDDISDLKAASKE